jgi:DNA-cytosine methyltransferase
VKALDLFCGAGGASIGVHAAGYTVHGYDKWPDALATHNRNGLWAGELDLSVMTAEHWREHIALTGIHYDLMWASPPCQGWSQGGKQLGQGDERNGFPWTLEAIEGVRPRLVITENVRGLTFKKNLPYLEAEVVEPLKAMGYRAEWRLLNCANYGIPQKRHRLFIVARLDGESCWPEQTHSDPKAKAGLVPGTVPWVTMAEALGWTPDGEVFPMLNTGGDWKKGADRSEAQTKDPATDPSPTVRGVPFQSSWQFPDGARVQVNEMEQAVLQSFPVTPPLPAWAHDEPAPTLSTTFGAVGGRKLGGHRNLTLPEAKILQAFPEGYEFLGTRTSQYLQIGNSVPPPMAYLLAEANRLD